MTLIQLLPVLIQYLQAEKVQLEVDGLNVWGSISRNDSLGREDVLINLRSSEKMHKDVPEPKSALKGARDDIIETTTNDFFVIRHKKWKFYSGEYVEQGWDNKNSLPSTTFKSGVGKGKKLYDLESDPREEHDVSQSYPDLVDEILAKKYAYTEKMTWIGKRYSNSRLSKANLWKPWIGAYLPKLNCTSCVRNCEIFFDQV